MEIIETKNLNFSYGKQQVLKDIDLRVPENTIFGFLGANGAGKSTTIRILLGLIAAPADSVFLFGKKLNHNRTEILDKIGALIDYPTFYEHLSARKNLRVITALLGLKNDRIDHTLQMVGLENTGNKKVAEYSVGMKQRLGLAMALINDPPLLILDEPANGLDPMGIIELRNLLLTLQKDHGKTIFLSSHILDELEKVATHIAILHKGAIRFQGTKEALIQDAGNLESSFLKMTT
ncbi:MAG: ATP-binding cassette domain-containing protein [Leptolyngbya sp. SIO1D8]|nr:ATP-binding cassette domain-containing protein [Leptolyngbya sp. SIO1D8]